MTFDLSIIFNIPESQYLRCVASNVNVAFAFKIRNHRTLRCFFYLSFKIRNHRALRCKLRNVAFAIKIRNHCALRCKLRNVAFAIKIRNHRALRCFLDLSV